MVKLATVLETTDNTAPELFLKDSENSYTYGDISNPCTSSRTGEALE
jgi:hypothetical protein